MPSALVFDAYGTLFDVHSVQARCDSLWPGKGAQLSQLWRAKQLEYTWLRSLMRRYAPFSQVTGEALAVDKHATARTGQPGDGIIVGRSGRLGNPVWRERGRDDCGGDAGSDT